jgi:alpha-mannosidase
MIALVDRAAQGGDYADENTRTDFLTLNHFVDLSEESFGVTLSSAESPFFRLGQSSVGLLDATALSLFTVVGMQVDGVNLGIQSQGGDTDFINRYALQTHATFDPAKAMAFSLAHQNPLVSVEATGGAEAPYPASSFSLLQSDNPNILLWAVKPAEEGIAQGIIVRLWNLANSSEDLLLRAPGSVVVRANKSTHVEVDLGEAVVQEGALSDSLQKQQLQTYRLFVSDQPPVDDGNIDNVASCGCRVASKEPGSMWLLPTGLVVLLYLSRRRQ